MRLDTIKCFNSWPCVQQEVVNLTLLYFDGILNVYNIHEPSFLGINEWNVYDSGRYRWRT